MDRYSPLRRNTNKSVFGVNRDVCRQFINGSCRYGRSCHYLHEWPVVPSVQVCRYFQKGGCWFGDRCRYLHIPHTDGGASGSRRGSAPAVHTLAWGGPAAAHRRGSEPSLPSDHGAYGLGRRGSEPLVNNMTGLQQNFERLTMGIAEEEEYGIPEAIPGSQPQDVPSQPPHHQTSADHTWSGTATGLTAGTERALGPPPHTEASSQSSSTAESPGRCGAAAPPSGDGSLAYQRSKDVSCGICMDKVYEKPSAQERRFGILPNCSHAFCLGCIITWRKTKDFQEDVIKSCPQCRVKSSFYIPSKYWVGDGERKRTLIASFKEKSSKIRCNFFMRHGCCPFNSECIYRHELPPGYRPRRRRSGPQNTSVSPGDLDHIDSLQLLDYVIAVTLLDEADILDFLDVPLYSDDDDDDDFDLF